MRPAPLGAGDRLHRITIETPGPPVPDGDGGFTETWAPIAAPLFARIAPAIAADLERLSSGTVITIATHVVRMPYLPGVTTTARVAWGARRFSIAGVSNIEERNVQLVLLCVELDPGAVPPTRGVH